MIKSFQRVGKKATVYAIGYQRTGRILLAKFWWIFLEAETEAIGVEAEAVCKYTASTALVYSSRCGRSYHSAILAVITVGQIPVKPSKQNTPALGVSVKSVRLVAGRLGFYSR